MSVDADAVILAGDIHRTTQGLRWARERWPDLPMVYVPGNHEFYGSHLFGMLQKCEKWLRGWIFIYFPTMPWCLAIRVF